MGVSDGGGGGGLNFNKEIPLKNEPNESCEKVSKLKISLKFAPDNRQVWSEKPRPTCGDFDFEFFFTDPQLHQNFTPLKKIFALFYHYSDLS